MEESGPGNMDPFKNEGAAPLREAGPEIKEFETLVAAFKMSHSLEALRSITDLAPEDAPNHPVREPARKDLIPIVTKMNAIEHETDVSKEKLLDLKGKYLVLSQAVGMIKDGRVDHTRKIKGVI